MRCDLHIHSKYSFDGVPTLDAICRAAMERHIDIIATTDHCDITDGPEGIRSYLENEAARLEEYAQVKEKYKVLKFLYGVEVGNPNDKPQIARTFVDAREFDFVIGAIHFLPDGSDVYKLPYPDLESIDTMFRQYFASMNHLAELGGFDTLAHLDYPLRVLNEKVTSPTITQYRNLVEPILEKIVAKGIALEINTRGIYDWQGRAGPEEWVLKRYKALGGKYVTIGSDAHTANWIGVGFNEAVELLRRAGFEAYTIYEKRVPQQIPI